METNKFPASRAFTDTEVVWQPVYDYLLATRNAETGRLPSELVFFQRAIGMNGATCLDTNMYLAGQFPVSVQFCLTGIRVYLVAGWGSEPNAERSAIDEFFLLNGGQLELYVGSRRYLVDSPLCKFPVLFPLPGQDRVKADLAERIQKYTQVSKRVYYEVVPPLLIRSYQNLCVILRGLDQWPVESKQVRIGVILDGFQYRSLKSPIP